MNNQIQHKINAQEDWVKRSFLEKMANIGSEVYRTISWTEKKNEEYAQKAFIRSLELIDLSKNNSLTLPQLKEICRIRELWVDFFQYNNKYKSSKEFFNKYFLDLTIAYKKGGKRKI